MGGGVVGFDITLVDGGGGVFLLHHQVGVSKSFSDVARSVAHMGGNVAGFVSGLSHIVSAHFFVKQRGVGIHRFAYIDDGLQYLVVDLDQRHRSLGDVAAYGRNGSHRMAFEQNFVTGHHMVRREFESCVLAT